MAEMVFLYVESFQPKLEYGVPFYRIPQKGEVLLAQKQLPDYYDFVQVGTKNQPVLLKGVPTKSNEYTTIDYDFIELDMESIIDLDIEDTYIDRINAYLDEEEKINKRFKMEEEIKAEVQKVAQDFDKESIEKAIKLVKMYRDLQLFDTAMADAVLELTTVLSENSEYANPLEDIEQSDQGSIANGYSAAKSIMDYIQKDDGKEYENLTNALNSLMKELKRIL